MKRYVREKLKAVIKLDDPPHKLALAFSLGIFIAFSPTIGLHIISCIVLAWIFRLSKFVILTASFVNNPWTIVPLYGFCMWVGLKITGGAVAVPDIKWHELSFSSAYIILKPFLWPFVVGTVVIGTAVAVISYFLIYWAVVRYRKIEKAG